MLASRLAAPLFALSLCITPALAQGACEARDTIVALSDIVLDKRGELPRLQARNFGAEAMYLKLRYEGLDDAAVEALLSNPDLAGTRHFSDLVFSWSVTKHGLAATTERLGPEEMEKALLASPSTVRALLAFNAADVVVNAFAALPDERGPAVVGHIYTALLDLPEAVKREVVDLALAKDKYMLAAAVAATADDRSLWDTVLARVDDPERAKQFLSMYGALPTFAGNAPIPRTANDTTDPALWAKFYEVAAAGALQPEIDLLNVFLNQTGLVEETLEAAHAVRAAFAEGALLPHGPLDTGWLYTYRALQDALADDAMLDDMLTGTSVSGRVQRPKMGDIMEWIIALDVLGPYLRGETDDAPQAPAGPYGAVRDWPAWIALADQARFAPLGVDPNADERTLAMAAEVLFAAGQSEALVRLLDAAPASLTSAALAGDFAERYDRGCDAYTWHMAESMVLAGTPIFKFDEAPDVAEAAPDRLKN